MNHAHAAFAAARDFLLVHRTDYAAACEGFAWPQLDEFRIKRSELRRAEAQRRSTGGEATLEYFEDIFK